MEIKDQNTCEFVDWFQSASRKKPIYTAVNIYQNASLVAYMLDNGIDPLMLYAAWSLCTFVSVAPRINWLH